ncbi:type IV secretion system protein [Stenotrophomonas sp. C3(2023)]|uniref:virB8 family protein n=1 Tax=Stenotrophomonas sp. C3(2023) TaxID=3080277 RepID=UPI00293C821D|nr:type IV secretion system protein [Stenotrophomonas sp. C3(2023)]MDV3470165.1 type IV secretion system protein [Stenotrophomonas sp. C3(2023)]
MSAQSGERADLLAQRRAVDFETSLMAVVNRSERRAWGVAIASVIVCMLCAGAVALMLPLKERVPYLVLADAGTGRATLTRLGADTEGVTYTGNEAITRANLTSFVRAREGYELSEIGERDWNIVFAMASADVRAAYAQLHAAGNPKALHKVHGHARSIRVQILSLQLADTAVAGARLATVRFQRSLRNNSNGESSVLDNRIATIAYVYDDALQMTEDARLLNPLGFRVTAYRVDTDLATSIPAAGSGEPA